MTHAQDLGALAQSIIDSNRYMTLGTADASGLPWGAPVWYASAEYREFLWVSSPGARHSRATACTAPPPPSTSCSTRTTGGGP